MAQNNFEKYLHGKGRTKSKSDEDKPSDEMPHMSIAEHKRMLAKKKSAGKGNPFAKKMVGKHPPPKKKGKKRPVKKSKLQKFNQSY